MTEDTHPPALLWWENHSSDRLPSSEQSDPFVQDLASETAVDLDELLVHGPGVYEQVDGVLHPQIQNAVRHGPDNVTPCPLCSGIEESSFLPGGVFDGSDGVLAPLEFFRRGHDHVLGQSDVVQVDVAVGAGVASRVGAEEDNPIRGANSRTMRSVISRICLSSCKFCCSGLLWLSVIRGFPCVMSVRESSRVGQGPTLRKAAVTRRPYLASRFASLLPFGPFARVTCPWAHRSFLCVNFLASSPV